MAFFGGGEEYSVCMYMFGDHKCIVKLPTATKNADSFLVIVFTTQRPVSDCSRPFSPVSLSWQSDSLTAGVPILNDQHPSSFSPLMSRGFTWAQFFTWSLRQNRQRKTFQTIWRYSRMLKIKLLIQRPQRTRPYIFTYTHECTLLYYTMFSC